MGKKKKNSPPQTCRGTQTSNCKHSRFSSELHSAPLLSVSSLCTHLWLVSDVRGALLLQQLHLLSQNHNKNLVHSGCPISKFCIGHIEKEVEREGLQCFCRCSSAAEVHECSISNWITAGSLVCPYERCFLKVGRTKHLLHPNLRAVRVRILLHLYPHLLLW